MPISSMPASVMIVLAGKIAMRTHAAGKRTVAFNPMPLLTCMYLGDRWECLFPRGGVNEIGVRAYSPHRLEAGDYWLQLPEENLWVF